jgi:hypothetical protein
MLRGLAASRLPTTALVRQTFLPEGKFLVKRTLVVVLLLMVFSVALANDEPVPAGTSLNALPEGSRVLIKQNIPRGVELPAFPGAFKQILYGKGSAMVTRGSSKAVTAGMQFPISRVDRDQSSARALILLKSVAEDDYITIAFDFRDGAYPQTVGDFDAKMGAYFSIIYDDPAYDPYPGMDKSVVVDIVMKKITAGLKENNPAKTLPQFAHLEKLGVPLPESFSYYYIETLEKAGKKDAARARAAAYLKTYGKKGKYYAPVIEIMGRL